MKKAFLVAVLLPASLYVFADGGGPAAASHPWPGPDPDDVCHKACLWPALQPGGAGRLQYSLCGDGTPEEALWDDGPENWDVSLGSTMEFDVVACPGVVQLRWETAANECGGKIACWTGTYTDVGPYWRLQSAIIWFDKGQYQQLSSDTWRAFASGHE